MKSDLIGHQTIIKIDDKEILTLDDILPESKNLKILFIAKTPAPVSVEAGHYFQGKQGTMFWNKLAKYKILTVPAGDFEDDHLLENLYGITDIVKVPRSYGNEPSNEEYKEGLIRILEMIKYYNPKVIFFVYKKVLDQILKLSFNMQIKSKYGFNHDFEKIFGTKVFVFPMPGTPCTTVQANYSMSELKKYLKISD
ncbi:MAG: uracil-DNA glycosylase family protein [Calditrichaceae bacterium]